MLATVSSEIIQGERPFFARTAPITTSQDLTALFNTIGCIVDVKTRLPTLFCNLRNRYTELSNTLTCAPRAIAARAAYSPTVPRSEEHTSELQSRENLVCRLLI